MLHRPRSPLAATLLPVYATLLAGCVQERDSAGEAEGLRAGLEAAGLVGGR